MQNNEFEQMIADTESLNGMSPRERNQLMVGQMDNVTTGEVKEASAAGSNMIRRIIRENGFARRCMPPQTVTNDELSRLPDSVRPVIVEDMEPKSKGAASFAFGTSNDAATYYEDRYTCVFYTVETPEFYKDINELRTTRMDLRQVITENSLKDIEAKEDSLFVNGLDQIVGDVDGVGQSGVQQNFEIEGGITRETYPEILSILEDVQLNNGLILMNRRTAKQFLKWGRDEAGGDISQDMFKKGLTALQEADIMGVKHLFTIKNCIVST
jgi:hypothetical protein